jgi:hypothetical protein
LGKKLGAKPGVDVLVFFTTSLAELERRFRALKKTLDPADWQALRFVYRRADRPG